MFLKYTYWVIPTNINLSHSSVTSDINPCPNWSSMAEIQDIEVIRDKTKQVLQ